MRKDGKYDFLFHANRLFKPVGPLRPSGPASAVVYPAGDTARAAPDSVRPVPVFARPYRTNKNAQPYTMVDLALAAFNFSLPDDRLCPARLPAQ